MYGINKYGSKQRSVVGGTWAYECLLGSALFLWVAHICAQEVTASCSSYNFIKAHNIDTVSAKRGSKSVGALLPGDPCQELIFPIQVCSES